MALPNLVVSAVAEWNGKALSKASGQIGKFDRTVKNLGRTLGVTFSAAAILGYSKKAVAAYGEQIAEAKRLDTALRNLGFSFATAEAEGYIDTVERVTGINRDQLQPAFIQLAQVTRSTTFAQSMLNTALDISAGTGMDLTSATKILSQAYVGNYKGLSQLNLGYTKAQLSSKSYLEIEKLIATQYAGQSKNAADSYEGSLAKLKIAAEQASEQIGQGLVSALSVSSGGFDKLIDKVDNFGDSINGLITNIAYLSKDLKDLFAGIPGAGVLDNAAQGLKNYIGTFSIGNIRKLVDELKGRGGGFPQGLPSDLVNFRANIEKAKMDKEALKVQKNLAALQKKAALAEKNKLSLSQAAAHFDTQRISIAAALKATYDKETRLRLEALMAIEDENGALAIAKIEELKALQNNADMDRLKGITIIKDAVLASINEQLLTELRAINATELAEAEKERLRDIAFGKYNAAITAAGDIAEKTYYSERVQIQLTEIAKLASLSNTTNAALTLEKLRMDVNLNAIAKIREAQALADKERMDALVAYINLLKTLGGAGVGLAGASSDSIAALIGGSEAELDALTVEKAAIDSLNKVDELMKDLFKVYDNPGTSALAALGAVRNLKEDSYASSLMPFAGDSHLSAMARQSGMTYNVTVNAGVVGSEQTIVDAVQNAILSINRAGDSTAVAGAL